MTNLLKSIKTTFSKELVVHIASRLGESESGISKVLEGLLPVVLGGLIYKAEEGGIQAVSEISIKAYYSTNGNLKSVTELLGIMGSGGANEGILAQGGSLLSSMFGNCIGNITASVGEYAGVRVESAATVLTMVGALVPALLGQYAVRRNLDSQGLAAGLLNLKSAVSASLPLALQGLTALLWLGSMRTPATSAGKGSLHVSSTMPKATPVGVCPRWYQALLAFTSTMFIITFLLSCSR